MPCHAIPCYAMLCRVTLQCVGGASICQYNVSKFRVLQGARVLTPSGCSLSIAAAEFSLGNASLLSVRTNTCLA
jgi:hypothetical protein